MEKNIGLPDDAPLILVVDDNKNIRKYVSSIFETTSIVHEVSNEKEGLK